MIDPAAYRLNPDLPPVRAPPGSYGVELENAALSFNAPEKNRVQLADHVAKKMGKALPASKTLALRTPVDECQSTSIVLSAKRRDNSAGENRTA